GVFVDAEIVVAHPVETRAPWLGEYHRIFPGEFIDDRVRPGHGEALDQAGLLAHRRIVFWRRAGRADVGRRGAGPEVRGRDHQRIAVLPMPATFAHPVVDLVRDGRPPVGGDQP